MGQNFTLSSDVKKQIGSSILYQKWIECWLYIQEKSHCAVTTRQISHFLSAGMQLGFQAACKNVPRCTLERNRVNINKLTVTVVLHSHPLTT